VKEHRDNLTSVVEGEWREVVTPRQFDLRRRRRVARGRR
jgi:hypothetical protein